MIQNPQTKLEIAQDWKGVRKLCEGSHRQYQTGGGLINETRPEDSYNLPFVLAYAVLDQCLSDLRDQGNFTFAGRNLGPKMAASRLNLKWENYDLVESGREARNKLAHEAKLLSKEECIRYIQAIEAELRAWGVI